MSLKRTINLDDELLSAGNGWAFWVWVVNLVDWLVVNLWDKVLNALSWLDSASIMTTAGAESTQNSAIETVVVVESVIKSVVESESVVVDVGNSWTSNTDRGAEVNADVVGVACKSTVKYYFPHRRPKHVFIIYDRFVTR